MNSSKYWRVDRVEKISSLKKNISSSRSPQMRQAGGKKEGK